MPKRNDGSQILSCQECRALLPEYVKQELAHQPVETLYPAVTRHLQSCLDCEELYDVEFRRQGLLLPAPELATVAHDGVAQVIAEIREKREVKPYAWAGTLLEVGQLLRDEVTKGWRQIEILLAELHGPQAQAPTFAGLLHASPGAKGREEERDEEKDEEKDEEGDERGISLHAAPPDEQLDLRISWRPQKDNDQACRLELVFTLHDRFGDYSGVEVTLETEDRVQVATTNPLGVVEFGGLDCAQGAAMRLLIRIPAEQNDAGSSR